MKMNIEESIWTKYKPIVEANKRSANFKAAIVMMNQQS